MTPPRGAVPIRGVVISLLLAPMLATPGCRESMIAPTAVTSGSATVQVSRAPVLVGAGDIAKCDRPGVPGAELTAQLLDRIEGTIFTTGDNVYERGTATEFEQCYGPTWGRHRDRTRPSPGNHEYYTPGASGYFAYFGDRAGPPGLGYYSYPAGSWLVLSLNSNIAATAGSPQYEWVRQSLESHQGACTLAYWHHPVFNSGYDGNMAAMRPIWRLLHEYGADVVLSGHAHNYERFAPMDADGQRDDEQGIRSFVIGTGGSYFTNLTSPAANSERWQNDTFGVLKLTLYDDAYQWQFVPVAGRTYTDSGYWPCH